MKKEYVERFKKAVEEFNALPEIYKDSPRELIPEDADKEEIETYFKDNGGDTEKT